MAISLVQRVNVTTGASPVRVIPLAGTVGTGNLLVVSIQIQDGGGGITSIVDSGSNSYTTVTGSPAHASGSSNYEYLAYAKNVTGGSSFSVTVTMAVAGAYYYVSVYEISGADTTTPLITQSTGTGNSGVAATGTLSISQNAIIVFQSELDADGGLANETLTSGGTMFSPDSQFLFDGYHSVSGSEAVTITAGGGTGRWQIIAAAFAEAGGGSPPAATVKSLAALGVG